MAQGANTFQIVSPVSPDIAQAERVVASTYGDTVSVLEKKKDLLKFGRNFAAGTSYSTVWAYGDTLATEVLPTTNAIDTVSSSSTSDTGTVVIEGHTISGSDLTFVVQTATLSGVLKKSSAFADFQLQIRNPGEVFRTVDIITASSSGGAVETTYSPRIIVPKNSDVRVICAADTANTDVIASIYGSLAKVI